MIDQDDYRQGPMWTNWTMQKIAKNWTMFTQMSQPFTSIYNQLFSLRPKLCHNIALPLSSSKKE